jgi:RNA polymerase sigma-70 factor (ECF subfamily)
VTDDRSIEELLVAVSEQDRAAFRTLYERTSAKLYGVVLRILPDRAQAEDAMQEVYVKLWRSAAGYDASRGKPITWLAAIARNLAIDVRRREGARGADRDSGIDPEMLTSRPDAASGEALAALSACLDRLDPEQRRLILAAYCQGDSRDELAERLGHPVGTIKSWLHRGLASLKTCLGG